MPSNIVFGFEEDEWTTTTATHLEASEDSIRVFGAGHFKEKVNPDNKSVHWRLGNDRTDYSTSNMLPDPRRAGGSQAKNCKGDIKKTNYTLGHETVDYNWKQGPTLDEINYFTEQQIIAKKNAAVPESADVTKKNIVWGFDKREMNSEAKRQFADPKFAGQTRQEKEKIETFVRQLKTCAVSLGSDKVDYSTTNRLPDHDAVRRGMAGRMTSDNKVMQQRSSIVFGYNKNEYQTSMRTHY